MFFSSVSLRVPNCNDEMEVEEMTSYRSTEFPRSGDSGPSLKWLLHIRGAGVIEWSWCERGDPLVDELMPIRTPRSSMSNRHIPVSAYAMTNAAVLQLESGLEHDLVRRLDRDPTISRMVTQPVRLQWTGIEQTTHTPDLLTVDAPGVVTVWDVRAVDQQDDDFRVKSRLTLSACTAVGWRYEVFTGLEERERLNLLWLHGFRRKPLWNDRHEDVIRTMATTGNLTLGNLFRADDGSGELKSVVWHLLWKGDLQIDMDAHWTLHTAVSLNTGG